jgi:hypothetical protein
MLFHTDSDVTGIAISEGAGPIFDGSAVIEDLLGSPLIFGAFLS